jgi:hypothetical protein
MMHRYLSSIKKGLLKNLDEYAIMKEMSIEELKEYKSANKFYWPKEL